MQSAAGGLSIVLILLAILLVVLWVVLPFAIFGLKPLLRELLAEQRRTNQMIDKLGRAVCEYGDAAVASRLPPGDHAPPRT